MIRLLKKIRNFLFRYKLYEKKLNITIKNSFESLYQIKKNSQKNLKDFEIQGFSQFGEDGLIRFITDHVKISNKIFIELGVEDYEEANTRMLIEYNWTGLVVEANKNYCKHIEAQDYIFRNSLICKNFFITKENINKIIADSKIFGKIGLLSIDLDGNDYWIWKEINVIDPDIVIIEYNSRFGNSSVTIPYESNFVRGKKYHKVYFGASLKALIKLGKTKGYHFVCTNSNGNNAFFVKSSLINQKVKSLTFEEGFNKKTFKETSDDMNINLLLYPIIYI